ncbi:hypothetical protein OU5_5210 [Pseudomonas mandelii JR-1]|uniref:Uncharacterized protein n=1 Tax=Pseudomonas mandelii JR-1 TaxID=1147786 RepID=A0A024EH96_9PSED|nr:hypothetical protein OU5_5210 [Pseudomonas mandelii JR-1]
MAHDAGADKSDFSHEKFLLFLLLCSQNSWVSARTPSRASLAPTGTCLSPCCVST